MKDYINYILYCFETWGEILILNKFNTTFTMIVDWSGEEIDKETANYYLDSIWDFINSHYPLKLDKIHLVNMKLENSQMTHELQEKKRVIVHDELYKFSLLSYFNQYKLHHRYGGQSMIEYDITRLTKTNDLVGFITSYVLLDKNN